MLTSLFGDLTPTPRDPASEGSDSRFAATAILESVAAEVNERGQIVDRHTRDLVVSGSPAQAIRDHFAFTRADLDTASRMITLLDPQGVWASAVVRALSDAGGQPIERLHLRENTTLRTIAMIERTTLMRRQEDPLKIVHADVRAPGPENAEIPVALMERSHLTTVVVGPMQPHAVDALLVSLRAAALLPTWRCPNVLFMLPPGAVWIANKIAAVRWPAGLSVHVLSEPMTSASAVWNAMLALWNQLRTQPAGVTAAGAEAAVRPREAGGGAPAVLRVSREVLDAAQARRMLAEIADLDGVLGCAVVDVATGLVIARELASIGHDEFDFACAASARVLRTHRQAASEMGLAEPVDEVITVAGARQLILRTVTSHPELFVIVLVDRPRANLALVRYRLADAERGLA